MTPCAAGQASSRRELARGAAGITPEIAVEVRLVVIAAGDGEIGPALRVRRADALDRMGEAQDAGDRLGAQAHLGVEALDQGLAAAGEIAAERADRARAVACVQARERPGNIRRHGPAAAKTLQKETVHEVQARRPVARIV